MTSTKLPYRIKRLIGEGAIAHVHLVTDENKDVACKILHTDKKHLVEYFLQEIEILKGMEHPNIIHFDKAGWIEDIPYYTMQYINGVTGDIYAERLQRLPPSERHSTVLSIALQMIQALIYLQTKGIIHRDIKPSNIIIPYKKNNSFTSTVTLLDFGSALDTAKPLLSENFIGTPNFAAPEQISNLTLEHNTDQFALGATLYFLLVHKKPFQGKTRHPPTTLSLLDPSIPEFLEKCIMKMLQLQPKDRYGDLQELYQELSAIEVDDFPLAGRQEILETCSAVIQRVHQGEQLRIHIRGQHGVGKRWIGHIVRNTAKRQGLLVYDIHDEKTAQIAYQQVLKRHPILIIDQSPLGQNLGIPCSTVEMQPLGLAEIRRSIYAFAPKTTEISKISTLVYFLTGGLPSLLLPLLRKYTSDYIFALPTHPLVVPETGEFFRSITDIENCILRYIAEHKEFTSVMDIFQNVSRQFADITEEILIETLQHLVHQSLLQKNHTGYQISTEFFRMYVLNIPTCAIPDLALSATNTEDAFFADCLDITHMTSSGQLSFAKEKAILSLAQQDSLQQKAMVSTILGMVHLDIGNTSEADKILADSTALSKALSITEFYILSQTLRARTSLEKNNSNSLGAIQAMERLSIFLPSNYPLVLATWSWSLGALGDKANWKIWTAKTIDVLSHPEIYSTHSFISSKKIHEIMVIRCYFCLIRGACAIGDFPYATELIEKIVTIAQKYDLLHWEIQRVYCLLHQSIPPLTGLLAYNLHPEEILLLKKRWIRAKNLHPDATWE